MKNVFKQIKQIRVAWLRWKLRTLKADIVRAQRDVKEHISGLQHGIFRTEKQLSRLGALDRMSAPQVFRHRRRAFSGVASVSQDGG